MYDDRRQKRLTDRVRQELCEDATTPDRLTSVVTEQVPSPVPGRVLLCFARHGGADETGASTVESGMPASELEIPDNAIEAALAVEFAALHQYLHAIPTADVLEAPAHDSPYADDAVAAIIDSDWLQAAAFTRVSAGAPSPTAAQRCYAALADGSTGCYERWRRASHDASPMAPLTATAGRIGAIVAGLDREAAATAADVAGEVGASIGIRSPTGTLGGAAGVPDRESLVGELAGVVPEPEPVADALRTLATAEPHVEAGEPTEGGP